MGSIYRPVALQDVQFGRTASAAEPGERPASVLNNPLRAVFMTERSLGERNARRVAAARSYCPAPTAANTSRPTFLLLIGPRPPTPHLPAGEVATPVAARRH